MDRVSQWLKLARFAPSGANQQNWKVTVETESPTSIQLRLGLRHEAGDLLDLSGGGALIGLGALAETLILVAAKDDWTLTQMQVLSAESLTRTRVELGFSAQAPIVPKISNHLYEQILLRRTNRFPYQGRVLESSHREIVFEENKMFRVRVLEFEANKKDCLNLLKPLVKLQSLNKNIFFCTVREIHLLRDFVRLDAIPYQASGVSLLGYGMLRVLQSWPELYPVIKLGMTIPFVAQGWTQPILKSGMLYHFSMKHAGSEDWISLGRFIQRTWLNWTRAGLVAQPFGVPLLAYGALNGLARDILTHAEMSAISQIRVNLLKATAIDLQLPGVFFRVGYPTVETKFTPRCPLVGATVDGFRP